MLLTFLIWKHTYSYISENNFGPSNQITVPTGYEVHFTSHPGVPGQTIHTTTQAKEMLRKGLSY